MERAKLIAKLQLHYLALTNSKIPNLSIPNFISLHNLVIKDLIFFKITIHSLALVQQSVLINRLLIPAFLLLLKFPMTYKE